MLIEGFLYMPLPLCHGPLTAMCHFSPTNLTLPPYHCQSSANYRCDTATLPLLSPTHLKLLSCTPSTDMPMSLFHYSHQHISDCHSATSPNYRHATVTQWLLPLKPLPLPPCHCCHQQAWHCYPATILINTLATATKPQSSPKHLPMLPCNCSHQHT